jgi:signal transduction histidine kinase
MNLAHNAAAATAPGGQLIVQTANVEIDASFTSLHPDMKCGDHVVLTVSDDGCGMSEETLGRIFEPFFTSKQMGDGAGMGLATCYGIVRQSGGHIYVASELEMGTTFTVCLPRLRPAS